MGRPIRDAIRRTFTGDHGDHHATRREIDRSDPEQLDPAEVAAILKDRPR